VLILAYMLGQLTLGAIAFAMLATELRVQPSDRPQAAPG